MALTISIHGGSTLSLAHNRRTILNEPHIDYSRSHLNVVLERHHRPDFYKEIFGDAIEEYNKKQTRADRGINVYNSAGDIEGSKVVTWCRATKAKEREFIIAFGSSNDGYSYDLKKEMLEEYFKEFKERNPNLKVMDAVIHVDECDEDNKERVWQPHLHIVVVPVAESARGVRLKMSMDAALAGQQGAVYDRKTKKRFSEFFPKWRDGELDVAKKVLKDRKISFKDGDKRKHHIPTKEYKDLMRKFEVLKKDHIELYGKNLKLIRAVESQEKTFRGTEEKMDDLQDLYENSLEVIEELELEKTFLAKENKLIKIFDETVKKLRRSFGDVVYEAVEDCLVFFNELYEARKPPMEIFESTWKRVIGWFNDIKNSRDVAVQDDFIDR